MKDLPLGPLVIDIGGMELTDFDRERLCHPLVGGLILFARNYRDRQQLASLCAEIHALRDPALLIGIDHEGGRVQRCRSGFTCLPAMRRLGEWWDRAPQDALAAAEATGYVLAAELRACGVDFSFTPVLDLDWGRSGVIGDRAFHSSPEGVVALAGALIRGLRRAGMIACGKHFPGHGWVEADSHLAIPIDERDLAALQTDLIPYRRLDLDAVMPAHVIYPKCDKNTAGFSKFWNQYLRKNIKFSGVIFSDDLSMQGAAFAGDIVERATAADQAGCDLLLVCNAPEAVGDLLARWRPESPRNPDRLARLRPSQTVPDDKALSVDRHYQSCLAAMAPLLA